MNSGSVKQCFISHCSDDSALSNRLDETLRSQFDSNSCTFFYTSGTNNTTDTGDKRSQAIRNAIRDSDLMIAVITDSYLRSIISISELSAFWYLQKTVIPIVFDKDGIDFLKELMGEDVIYIHLGDKNPAHIRYCAEQMMKTMANHGFVPINEENAGQALYDLFSNCEQAKPRRRYIGSGENYENIDRYCEQYGVSRFSNSGYPVGELTQKISGCKELYILATTGGNLINALSSEYLPDALAKGMNLTVLIPNRYSSFVADVAEIEEMDDIKGNKKRFADQFDGVVYNLKRCLSKARKIAQSTGSDRCGEIFIGCSFNLIRQTITLAEWNDRIWGWLSVTIPPKRAVDGTPSIEFSGEKSESSMGKLIYDHVTAIKEISIRRGAWYRLSDHDDFSAFFLENESAEAYWKDLYQKAKQNSLLRDGESELIEVAAQHPLRPDGKPGKEFEKRLKRAEKLYHQLLNEGRNVHIYVPGSVHNYKGKTDPCSLSKAGKDYLISLGIPETDILGDEENIKFKGDRGVYNTADECYVASRIFFEGDYSRLHCVCSPNQLLRKKLFYVAFGVIPFFYTVNAENLAHDEIYELFHAIPDIIEHDHTWQDIGSFHGNRTRAERDPRLVSGSVTGE